jgi:hypothetical protein
MPSAMSLGRDNGLPANVVAFSTDGETSVSSIRIIVTAPHDEWSS